MTPETNDPLRAGREATETPPGGSEKNVPMTAPAVDEGATMTATLEQAVTIRGLTRSYGSFKAVEDLDLDIPAGSVFGLIGPNGAGKTTTMSTIVTLAEPDAGTVRVFGKDPVSETREVRSMVGFMPDFFGLYDGLTCEEYLDFFGAAYGVEPERRKAQVNALLELVELDHKRDVDVSGLSRGMQQRLSLARALVHEPRLLVLDEPASGLDPRARVELREIIRELARQGHTILLSSHILSEMQDLCDRVGIIEAGKMLAQGTPDEINLSLKTARAVTVRVLGDEVERQRALDILAANGAATAVLENGALRAEVPGGPDESAALLTTLVTQGVRVIEFTEEKSGLEGLFLRLTQGIVR